MDRKILHIDMNNCFASIEIKLNPKLRGLPIAVSGSEDDRHGIILAKSNEAKKYGVKTAETIWQARKKCPNLILVKPHYEEYKKHSKWARRIYYSYTNLVEPFGLDEAWIDVTGSQKLFGTPYEIAEKIRKQIKEELGITVSIGVSFNKIFAKLGSDMKKPDAITVIDRKNFKEKVWPLKVEEMIGVGNATRKKLNDNGIYTLGQLANSKKEKIESLFGINGIKLWENANGLDKSEVRDFYDVEPIKSISNGMTLSQNLENLEEVHNIFQLLSLKVGNRLINRRLKAYGIQISIKDSDLNIQSYQETYDLSTDSSIILLERAMNLFKKYKWKKNIRFLELRAINLTEDENIQIGFLHEDDIDTKKEKLGKTLHELRKNFGEDMVSFASLKKENKKIPKNFGGINSLPTNRGE